jgi:hypothetical protein
MTDQSCQRYLEDPEANASHLDECADCRALAARLGEAVEHRPVVVDAGALPLASWEGAAHRSWPLVLGSALTVVAVALALCAATGMSPLRVMDASMGSMSALRALIRGGADALRGAPISGQVAFGVAVVLVNALLVVLLRRAPRGIDA